MRDHCKPIIYKALRVVRPQFRLDHTNGIHGVPHWSRVWFHGRALAVAVDVNPQVLAWFAFLSSILDGSWKIPPVKEVS